MADLAFENIHALHLLWLATLMALVYAYGVRRRRRAMRAFATANLGKVLAPEVSATRRHLKAVLMLAATLLLVVGATGPKWGKRVVEVRRQGIDLIVVLDVSRSMLAEDLRPSRLERAKVELTDMLANLHGDRIGLVTFAGDAVLTCPLTVNYGAFRTSLATVDTRSATRGGTVLGDAIRLAAESFPEGMQEHKAILVISDGGDQESMPVEAARDAFRETGARVFTVGFGDMIDGARIPVVENGQRQYLQYKGEQVWSKLDADLLEQVARDAGGVFFRVGTTDPDFAEVYRRIRGRVQARELEAREAEVLHPRYRWFAGAGLLLLLLETWITDRRPPRERVAMESAVYAYGDRAA